MQDLSARDGLSLLLSPLCVCFPRASNSTSDVLSPQTQPWYTPDGQSSHSFDPSHAWHPSDPSTRPADLLSLHSQTGRPRRRRGGGDVSGSGGNEGSGLSRWTLIKAWVWGDTRGRIRLESDEEGEGPLVEGHSGLGVQFGEEDAVLLTPEDAGEFDFFQAQSDRARSELAVDDRAEEDRVEDKAARRARRHRRRRARELGLTIQQFDEGVAVGDIPAPEEDAQDEELHPASKSRRHRAQPSSTATLSSGHLSPYEEPTATIDEPPKRRSKSRHDKRASISASSEGPSEDGLSASTLSTLDEQGPFTPQLAQHELYESTSASEAGSTRSKKRSKSRSRRSRSDVSVVEEEGELDPAFG